MQRTSHRLPIVNMLILLAMIGCEGADELSAGDADEGRSVESLSFVTSPEKMPATSYLTRYQFPNAGKNNVLAASVYFNTVPNPPHHFALMTRDLVSPYTLRLHKIAATPTDPLFGKKTSTIVTSCGALPCASEFGLTDAATLRYQVRGDYALFGYAGQIVDVSGGESGTTSARVMRVSQSLAHSVFSVHECLPSLGGTLQCRVHGPALAASTRNDGTDQALVSYMLEPNVAVNDWKIAGKLMSPSGVMTSLSSVSGCSYSPCNLSGFAPYIQSAYNA